MATKRRATRPGPVANPRRAAESKMVERDDHYLVTLGRRASRVHRLNASAALVLELADGTLSVPRIAAMVGEAYRLPQAPVEDVRRVLDQMATLGLITTASAGRAKAAAREHGPAAKKRPARKKAAARPKRKR